MALWFQRRRLKCEKLMDDRRRTPSGSKSSHCLWQGELKMNSSAAYKKQTLSHKLELSTHHHSSNEPYKNLVAIGTDSISRCKSYYQMIDAIMTKSMVNINLEYIKSI